MVATRARLRYSGAFAITVCGGHILKVVEAEGGKMSAELSAYPKTVRVPGIPTYDTSPLFVFEIAETELPSP